MSAGVPGYFQSIHRWATTRPDDQAVADTDPQGRRSTLTWRGLLIAAGALAQELSEWSQTNHRQAVVMTQSHNRAACFTAWAGSLLADAAILPLSIHAPQQERQALSTLAGVTHFLADHPSGLPGVIDQPMVGLGEGGSWDQAMDRLSRCVGQGSVLLQSSGTTGVSKVVRRTLPALEAVGRHCVQAVGMTAQDKLLATTALSHSYMVDHALMAAMMAGASAEVMHAFDPLLLTALARQQRATILPTVPFIADMLTQAQAVEPGDLATIRRIYTAGTNLPAGVARAFHAKFGRRVGQVYGSSEFGSVTCHLPVDDEDDPTLAGLPMAEVELRIVDRDRPDIHHPLPANVEGHVAVAATSMFSEYLGDHDASLQDGFFLSGDLGLLDDKGRLRITGRLKLLVDIAGQKVNLVELETLLGQYPGVKDVVVVPVEVTSTVSRLKALVVWKAEPGDLHAMRDWARPQVSPYKLPRLFETRDDLPRSPTGKILRHLIRIP